MLKGKRVLKKTWKVQKRRNWKRKGIFQPREVKKALVKDVFLPSLKKPPGGKI